MKKIIAAAILISSTQSFAQVSELKSIELKINIKGQDTYLMTSESIASGLDSVATTAVNISATDSTGKIESAFLGSETQTVKNMATLSDISNDSIRLTDLSQGIDQTLKASVSKKGFFAKTLTKLTISADTIKSIMANMLMKKGQDLVSELSIVNDEVVVNYSLDMSDYNCVRVDAKLTCDLDSTITVMIKEK